MKILLNRKIVNGPWGGGNKFVKNFFKFGTKNNNEIVNQFHKDIDVIHLQDLHADELGIDINAALRYKHEFNPKVKLIHRVNDMDLGRYDSKPWRDDLYLKCSHYLDATVFVSEWTKEFFMNKGWACKQNFVISNGVDKEIFYPAPQLKKNNGKINIVTHHWSRNKGKGFDIYEKIDEFVKNNPDFTFTYIGRERGTFKNSSVISPIFGKELGEELTKYDLYISASEYENCPNHILESLSCEIPTYACALGGASLGIVGNEHVFKDWQELENIILSKSYLKNTYKVQSWEDCIETYLKTYNEVSNK